MKHTFPIWLATFLLVACTSRSNPTQEKTEVLMESSEKSNSDTLDFILPQPISLAHSFKNAGLTYRAGKTNPVSSKNKYVLKIDQLLNLGVYTADLAYCALNHKSQEAREYLVTIQEIGAKVGLKSVFSDKSTIDRFDHNLDNSDSLEAIIYTLQDKSDIFLEDNDLKYLAAVQFAGAWTEGMYLGIEDCEKNGTLGTALVEQMVLLENTIKGLKKHPAKNDVRLRQTIAHFEAVFHFYNQLPSVAKASKNANFAAPKLTNEEFQQLAAKISLLRSTIVSPI
jgi:hypothetical protein